MDEKPIRVAQIVGKWNTGGVKTMLLEFGQHTNRDEVTFDYFIEQGSESIEAKELDELGYKKFVTPKIVNIFAYIKYLIGIFKQNNYTIVHAHINTLCVFPLFAAYCAGVPVRICHSHSTADKGENVLRVILKYFLRVFSKMFATNYLACGEIAGRWLYGNKCFDSGDVLVFNNGIDTEKFSFNEEYRKEIRKEFGFLDDDFVVGHAGRFCNQKNHYKLISIFRAIQSKNSKAKLLLVGVGPLEESVRRKINEDKNIKPDSVIFAGVRTDMAKIYSAMDVFCLPSRFEGMPVVAPEAQANGLPFICSNRVSKEALITNLAKTVAIEKSGEEWAHEIIEMYTQSFPRRSYSNEVLKAGFDIEQITNQLQNLYVELYKKAKTI